MVARYTPSELRGTAYGLHYLVVGGCLLVSNMAFGTLWNRLGLLAAYGYSAAASTAAIAGLNPVHQQPMNEIGTDSALPRSLQCFPAHFNEKVALKRRV